jgi:tetratricopeptide (TPR) repeat protein
LAVAPGAALADAAQDCQDATLASEERQTACETAAAEVAALESQGDAHLIAGRPEDALTAARRALEIAAYATLDSPEEAQAAAGRIVNLGPEYERVQGMLLQALVQTGAADEAVAAYREAQAAGVEDTTGHLAVDLAWGFYRTGEHEKALTIIEEWLAAHPEPAGHEDYHSRVGTLAHILAALGREEEAVQAFMRAVEIVGPEGPAYYSQGLTASGFAPEPGEEGFEAAIRACAAAGTACRLYDD